MESGVPWARVAGVAKVSRRAHALREILAIALTMEREGRRIFLDLAKHVRDPKARRMIRRMAAEELEHYMMLEEAFNDLQAPGTWLTNQEAATQHARALLRQKPVKAMSRLRRTRIDLLTEQEALAMGIKSERESIAFYEGASARAKDPVYRDLLEDFAAFERGHLRALEAQRENVKRVGKWLGRRRKAP